MMTDNELMDEIEELLETKIVYHSEMAKNGSPALHNKHIDQSTIYSDALELFRKMRAHERNVS